MIQKKSWKRNIKNTTIVLSAITVTALFSYALLKDFSFYSSLKNYLQEKEEILLCMDLFFTGIALFALKTGVVLLFPFVGEVGRLRLLGQLRKIFSRKPIG